MSIICGYESQRKGLNLGKFIKNVGAVYDLLLNTTQPISPAYKLGRIGFTILTYLESKSQMVPMILDFFNFPLLR